MLIKDGTVFRRLNFSQTNPGLFLPSRFFPLQCQSHTVLLGKPNEKRHQSPLGNLQKDQLA